MALNLSQKLKIATAAVGFSALPLTGCSDAEGSEQSASKTQATAPAAVETAPAERNMYIGDPDKVVVIYSEGIGKTYRRLITEILSELNQASPVFYEATVKDGLEKEEMQVWIGGYKVNTYTLPELFGGEMLGQTGRALEMYRGHLKKNEADLALD